MTARRSLLLAVVMMALAAPERSMAQDAAAEARARLLRGVERLSFLRGAWEASLLAPTAEGGWRETGRTTMVVAASMNDLYLETKVQSGHYMYEIIFSYDVAQDCYRVTSRDDQSGLIDVYEGVFDTSGALVVTNIESGTHYVSGGEQYHNRLTFAPEPAGGWSWLVEATSDGGATWSPQLKAKVQATR